MLAKLLSQKKKLLKRTEPEKPPKPTISSLGYCDFCGKEFFPGQGFYSDLDQADYDLCEMCFEGNFEAISEQVNMSPKHFFSRQTESSWSSYDKITKSTSMAELIDLPFSKYPTRPCFGERDENAWSGYYWTTYQEVKENALHFGSGLRALNLVSPRDMIAICTKTRIEYFITQLATIWHALTLVPMTEKVDNESINVIMNNSKASTLIVSKERIQDFIDLQKSSKLPHLKTIIVVDDIPGDFLTFSSIIQQGKKNYQIPLTSNPDDLRFIMYTSGSTGVPKGVMISDLYLKTICCSYWATRPLVVLSYLPLNHMTAVQIYLSVLVNGGRIGIHEGAGEGVFEGISVLRPTFLTAPPRFWNVVFNQYQEMIHDGETKENVKKNILQSLGGRLAVAVTGGAPSSEELLNWMKDCLSCNIGNAYGSTECGAITTNGVVNPSVSVKLIDCPELGYTTSDKPYPRGEILVQTSTMMLGYYGDPEKTNEVLKDGWYCTGDIGQLEGKVFRVIDRKKNIFKLAQKGKLLRVIDKKKIFVTYPSSFENFDSLDNSERHDT